MDAIAVAEFTLSFGAMVGMPAVTVPELMQAAAHPLAPGGGPRTMYRLYFTVLRYTLSQWASYGGKLMPRMRRWMRLLQRGGSTWQEVRGGVGAGGQGGKSVLSLMVFPAGGEAG